jgi:TldD protein
MFHRSGAATNGEPRDSAETQSAGFCVSVHVGERSFIGVGQAGAEIGRLEKKRVGEIRRGLEEAYNRGRTSAREKAAFAKRFGARAASLAGGAFEPRTPIRDEIAAVYKQDPRTLDAEDLKRITLEASREVKSLGRDIAFNAVAATSELRHELFISSEGSLISQAFAFSQGDVYVVAQSGEGHQESYDTIGQQRGFESIAEGWHEELLANPSLGGFAVGLAKEAQELAAAPVLKPPDREVTVVTDPHFNALVAHEIVGHPCEADRALKMEAAYAGRSWLLRSVNDNQVGKEIGSSLLSPTRRSTVTATIATITKVRPASVSRTSIAVCFAAS